MKAMSFSWMHSVCVCVCVSRCAWRHDDAYQVSRLRNVSALVRTTNVVAGSRRMLPLRTAVGDYSYPQAYKGLNVVLTVFIMCTTLDLLTLKLVCNVTPGKDKQSANFGDCAIFRCRVMGKHASWPLTFEVTAYDDDTGHRTPSLYRDWSS